VIHHVVLGVSDLEGSGEFYDSLLAPLGWRRHLQDDGVIGWGIAKPVFFVSADEKATPTHGLVCFSAPGIAAVKAAWESGMAHGGSSIDGPGEARRTGSGSYSAFLADPDGHSVEVTVSSE
jgi:catechol 2,3-dioxygenase-like lactoylglutathione lyase family enzyme